VWLQIRYNRVHRAHDDDDNMYDDDSELNDKYLGNERQAEEFRMQMLGATKAFDVGSILGTDVFRSDVLNEYDSNDQQRLSVTPFSSFAARKSNLLEYTVLTRCRRLSSRRMVVHPPMSQKWTGRSVSLLPSFDWRRYSLMHQDCNSKRGRLSKGCTSDIQRGSNEQRRWVNQLPRKN